MSERAVRGAAMCAERETSLFVGTTYRQQVLCRDAVGMAGRLEVWIWIAVCIMDAYRWADVRVWRSALIREDKKRHLTAHIVSVGLGWRLDWSGRVRRDGLVW